MSMSQLAMFSADTDEPSLVDVAGLLAGNGQSVHTATGARVSIVVDEQWRADALVAELVATQWNTTGQCALVVGATFPSEIARVREIVGDMPLLVPGIGAQGGDVEATVRAGRTSQANTPGRGLMINSSRAILYASKGEDYAEAARRVAEETRDTINRYR